MIGPAKRRKATCRCPQDLTGCGIFIRPEGIIIWGRRDVRLWVGPGYGGHGVQVHFIGASALAKCVPAQKKPVDFCTGFAPYNKPRGESSGADETDAFRQVENLLCSQRLTLENLQTIFCDRCPARLNAWMEAGIFGEK
jgi:hypothetical protein